MKPILLIIRLFVRDKFFDIFYVYKKSSPCGEPLIYFSKVYRCGIKSDSLLSARRSCVADWLCRLDLLC